MKPLRIAAFLTLGILPHPIYSGTLLAPTPPMGWNSWDSFGTGVTEDETKANADYMAKHLKSHGWKYIVVDIQWSEPNPKSHGYRPDARLTMDQFGRLQPAVNRFPSAANGAGFKPLADYIHKQGLLFGIHIMRGIPRAAVADNLAIFSGGYHAADIADKQSICPWNSDMYGIDVARPGAQDYYDSIARLYASWGVDFIKADDMFDARADHTKEIAALRKAISGTGRNIVLSLSPGTRNISFGPFLDEHAQMWRISNDFWDRWQDLKNQFELFRLWRPYRKPGHWPDGDMLPLGHIGLRAERGDPRMSLLTHDEQTTLMTLWSIANSPLMFGGNLPDNDPFTLSLLTNDEVLAVDQHATGGRELFHRGNQVAWMADAPNSLAKYLAVFNVGDTGEEDVRVNWADLGLTGRCTAHDLWSGKDAGTSPQGQSFHLKPHAAALYSVSASSSGRTP